MPDNMRCKDSTQENMHCAARELNELFLKKIKLFIQSIIKSSPEILNPHSCGVFLRGLACCHRKILILLLEIFWAEIHRSSYTHHYLPITLDSFNDSFFLENYFTKKIISNYFNC